MIIRNRLLILFFVVLVGTALESRGQVVLTWQVEKFDIDVSLPANPNVNRDIPVTAELTLKNKTQRSYRTATLRLMEEAVVNSVSVNGETADYSKGIEKITDSKNLQKVRIRIPSVSGGDSVKVKVSYKIPVKRNGGLQALSAYRSQLLPFSFWYPAPTSWFFPAGADFAPVEFSLKAPNGTQVVTAGKKTADGFSNELFGMPFFVQGKWKVETAGGVEVFAPINEAVVKERAGEIAALVSEAQSFFEKELGVELDAPLRVAAVERGAGFADSGVALVETGVFFSPSLDSTTAFSLIESVAKTFLGNKIRVNGNGWGVVREGLSRHLANSFYLKKFGVQASRVNRQRQISNYTAIAERDGPLNLVSPVDGSFYSASGNKGAMLWNFLATQYKDDFGKLLMNAVADRSLSLTELRNSFGGQKAYIDYSIEKVTGLNLMVGSPQNVAGGVKSALRNLGEIPVSVEVEATARDGKKTRTTITVPAKGFSEVKFEGLADVVRVEIDPDKLFTQTRYIDDIAPRPMDEDDPLVFIKKEFDRKRYENAIANAKTVLTLYPEFDEARIFLARAFLGQNNNAAAKSEFEKVLSQTTSTAKSHAWAQYGLGVIGSKAGDVNGARARFNNVLMINADFGTSLLARRARRSLSGPKQVNAAATAFFAAFDKAVIANSKRSVEGLIAPGEVTRFAGNVAGQAQQWTTTIVSVDVIDADVLLVEADVSLKLLNRNPESGLAVFRLTRSAGGFRLSNVDIFEVS